MMRRATLIVVVLLVVAATPAVAPASAMHACLDLQIDCFHQPESALCQPALKRIPGWWNTFCAEP